MSDPAIRAALEAAMQLLEQRCGPSDAEDRRNLAAAIAAFLRGLPGFSSRHRLGPPYLPEQLAAAVEAAAKEPGHE